MKEPSYRLTESELPTVLSLFGTLKQGFIAGRLKSLDTAFRRFNLSYSREMDEDRLIDLTIALESSVLFNQADELTYRLAIRGAKLLADHTPPKQTKALLEAMYEIRSAIVHNGKMISDKLAGLRDLSPAPSSSTEFANQCADVVRRILKAYVGLLTSRNQSLREANRQLDEEIVAALAPADKVD